jgi:putative PEP-CTERM system TPR-repeat lipoprotein
LRRALSIDPNLVTAQRGIMALQREGGRVDDAIATARQVQKRRPKQSVGYLLEGDLLASEKKWTEAAKAYRAGLKQSGTTDLAVRLHSTLLASGDKGSEQFANEWLKEHPKDDAFRFHIAQSATAKKDYATAVQHYRKLLEHQPSNALLLNNLAWAAGKLNDPQALEYGEQANKLAPNQPVIMDTLGMLLMERGHVARGLELLQQASALAPQAHEIRLNYARSLIKAGKTDAARKELAHLSKLGSKFKDHAEVERLIQSL